MTVFEFCKEHRVEVIMGRAGIYECWIDYQQGDRPWGTGTNCLDAIDNGVVNYLKIKAQQMQKTTGTIDIDVSECTKFFSTEGLIFWYYFACKYNLPKYTEYYEKKCMEKGPGYKEIMQHITYNANETIKDINLIVHGYPAVHNIFVQAIVYYESLKQDIFENAAVIRDLIKKTSERDQEGFYRIQNTIAEIDIEIQKLRDE